MKRILLIHRVERIMRSAWTNIFPIYRIGPTIKQWTSDLSVMDMALGLYWHDFSWVKIKKKYKTTIFFSFRLNFLFHSIDASYVKYNNESIADRFFSNKLLRQLRILSTWIDYAYGMVVIGYGICKFEINFAKNQKKKKKRKKNYIHMNKIKSKKLNSIIRVFVAIWTDRHISLSWKYEILTFNKCST